MAELHEQAARVAEAAIKLVEEVARLRKDIERLHGRIEPFEGEAPNPYVLTPPSRIRNFVEALEVIASARNSIQGCEYHLSAIRGVIDNIGSDAISREDIKPWLKDKG